MTERLVRAEFSEPGIVRIVIDDAQTRNAMSERMAEEFRALICELSQRLDLRVAVLSGAGKAFSAGGHLEMLLQKAELDREQNVEKMLLFYESFLSICELRIPVVAAIDGPAIGAGLCVALACDIRVCSSSAKFGLNFVRIGLHPGMGVTFFGPRVLGKAALSELLYTGKIIGAERALTLGLVSNIFPDDGFEKAVDDLVREIASAGPQSVRALKASLRASEGSSLVQSLNREAQEQALSYQSAEFKEGISSILEKRKANF